MLSLLFPHNGSHWQGFPLPAAERSLALPGSARALGAALRLPFLSHQPQGTWKTTSWVIPHTLLCTSPACTASALEQEQGIGCSRARTGHTVAVPAALVAIQHLAAALGFPLHSKTLMQSNCASHPAQAALTLPCRSGGMGAGRFGNSLRAETRRFGQLAGRSRPVPRQPRLRLWGCSSLSARLDDQPQRCPLDGKHLVRLAARRGHLLLEEGRPRGTGTLLNNLQLQPDAASADGKAVPGVAARSVIERHSDLWRRLGGDSPHSRGCRLPAPPMCCSPGSPHSFRACPPRCRAQPFREGCWLLR